jgi:hypothetical protein
MTTTLTQNARITGHVEYREGDGPMIAIPRGPCDVEQGEQDVTIAWSDGDTRGSTAMPRFEFERYVERGAIALDAPAR